jgi:hypothetical protein
MTLDELLSLAEGATPGPWEVNDDERDCMVLTAKDSRWVANVGNWARQNAAIGEADPGHESMLRNVFEFDTADAAYIAALSPEVVRALVRVAQVAERMDRSGIAGGDYVGAMSDIRQALDALKAVLS